MMDDNLRKITNDIGRGKLVEFSVIWRGTGKGYWVRGNMALLAGPYTTKEGAEARMQQMKLEQGLINP